VLNPTVLEGGNATADTFTIENTGVGTLSYTITDDVSWLSVSPSTGTSTGETDTITVNYSTSTLLFGTYVGTITISDVAAENDPQTITVNLTVQSQAIPPEITNPDFEHDGPFFIGPATGWTGLGGNKWEGVWSSEHPVAQGVSEINVGGECGVYQTIDVTPDIIYRVSVVGLVVGQNQAPVYEFSIGADPTGGTSTSSATFGTPSTSTGWTEVTADFTATGPSATIFLRARNLGSTFVNGKWCAFDDVAIEIIGNVNPPTVPPDFDGDRDVDLGDFGHFQLCLTGPNGTASPDCEDADFDLDGDVDLSDFGAFQRCFSGPNIDADLNCAAP
jgi:hypothetical protein